MNHTKYNSKLDPKQQKSDADSAVTAVPVASAPGNVTPIRTEGDAELKHKDTDTEAHQGPSSPVIAQTTGDATADMMMTRQDDEHAASKLAHSGAAGKPAVVEKAALTSLPHVTGSQEMAPTMSAKAAD